jgi:hypothetical protein
VVINNVTSVHSGHCLIYANDCKAISRPAKRPFLDLGGSILRFFRSADAVRAFALAVLFAIVSAPAHSQSFQVAGKFGYLSEYELSADIVPKAVNEKNEFSGSMTIRHVGLCTHDGPTQMDGQIVLQFSGMKSPDVKSRIAATLYFDGQRCTFSGRMSEAEIGELVCSGGPVPFSIWSR